MMVLIILMVNHYVEFILHVNQAHAQTDWSSDCGQLPWFLMYLHLDKSLNQQWY